MPSALPRLPPPQRELRSRAARSPLDCRSPTSRRPPRQSCTHRVYVVSQAPAVRQGQGQEQHPVCELPAQRGGDGSGEGLVWSATAKTLTLAPHTPSHRCARLIDQRVALGETNILPPSGSDTHGRGFPEGHVIRTLQRSFGPFRSFLLSAIIKHRSRHSRWRLLSCSSSNWLLQESLLGHVPGRPTTPETARL